MLQLDYDLRKMFYGIDDRGTPMDSAIRDVLAVAITINAHRLWKDVRLLSIKDVAKTVTEATGPLVDYVKLVTPSDITAEMLLWPPKDTLWDGSVIPLLSERAPNKHVAMMRLHSMVTREIDDLARFGIRKNFSQRFDRSTVDQLERQFSKAAGDACAAHLGFTFMGDTEAATRTGALISLFVHAPFMTRDPLNPHKLLILVDNDI